MFTKISSTMLAVKPTLALSRPQVRAVAVRPRSVVVRASGVDLNKKVEQAVKEAEDACAKGTSAVRLWLSSGCEVDRIGCARYRAWSVTHGVGLPVVFFIVS